MPATQQFGLKKKVLLSAASFLIVLVLIVVVGEVIMRISYKPLIAPYNLHEKDSKLNWRVKPWYHYHTDSFPDNKGGKYSVELNFDAHGFRMWNEHAYDSTVGTVFVIGDSYVESVESSDDKVFYAYLRDSLPVNVYAYGAAGYGTVQELLVLRQYLDSVKPKWVVLETCPNDYMDNYWELAKTAGYHFPEDRFYLMPDNTLELHYNGMWYEKIKNYSLFIDFLIKRTKNSLIYLGLTKEPVIAEHRMNNEGRAFKEYDTACRLTDNCLKNVKRLVESKGGRLIVLVLGYNPPERKEMNDMVAICVANDIPVVTGAEKALGEHAFLGETIHSFDNYHYCNSGQKVVGEVLVQYFIDHELK